MSNSGSMSKDFLISMYRSMTLIRKFEEKVFELFKNGTVVGTTHLCIGQEAVPVGVCSALRPDDYTVCTYRGHGVLIARGSDINRLMAEILGKVTGVCKGKGGSMHLTDLSKNVLGSLGIVGQGLPVAVGAALSSTMRGEDRIAVAFFGDGAANIGTFHEALNLASVWKLPVLFACENNLYGEHTPINQTTPLENISDRAVAYRMPGLVVDGNNALEVYQKASKAISEIRSGGGPQLLEFKTYRHKGHSKDDDGTHRPREELEYWMKRDPVASFRTFLLKEGYMNEESNSHLESQLKKEVERAATFAKSSPYPSSESLLSDVFSGN